MQGGKCVIYFFQIIVIKDVNRIHNCTNSHLNHMVYNLFVQLFTTLLITSMNI